MPQFINTNVYDNNVKIKHTIKGELKCHNLLIPMSMTTMSKLSIQLKENSNATIY